MEQLTVDAQSGYPLAVVSESEQRWLPQQLLTLFGDSADDDCLENKLNNMSQFVDTCEDENTETVARTSVSLKTACGGQKRKYDNCVGMCILQ